MRHAHILLALALIGAAPCAPATLPIGTWTYGRIAITPPQSASIQRDGSAVVVDDFPADRAFTTTASRYDESTLDLRSARQHASCCANEWSAIVTRSADGSYEVVAKHLAPGGGNMKVTVQRAHIPASGRHVVVNAMALLPWMYRVTNARAIDDISLPGLSGNAITVQTLGIAEADNAAVPHAFPSDERALRVTSDSGTPTLLWYDPCTFVVDGFEHAGRLIVRNGLDASR